MSSSGPLLSVVAPFYNVEPFIEACLESLRRQSLTDLEVILVDDGSPDGSAAIAERYCALDSRFRILRQENSGIAAARNSGAAAATGQYLVFADTDDVVELGSYAAAVASLEASGSDFAAFRASRFDVLGVRPSIAHDHAIRASITGTHLREHPELALDRLPWNKVYRKSFWDRADLSYPPILFEDYPLCMAAHVAAERIDLLDRIGYFWRQRDTGAASVTQRSAESLHISDRLASDGRVLDLLEPLGGEVLQHARKHLLEIDVQAMAAAAVGQPRGEEGPYLESAQRLLARLGPEAVEAASPYHRAQAALVAAGDLHDLRRLHAYAKRAGRVGRIRANHDGQWIEDLPGAPRGTVDVPGPSVRAALDDAVWVKGILELTVVLESRSRLGRTAVDVWLRGENDSRVSLPAKVRARPRPYVGTDNVEVQVRIDPARITVDERLLRGFRSLMVGVTSPTLTETCAVVGPSHGRGRYPAAFGVVDSTKLPGLVIQPYRRGHEFGLTGHRPIAQLSSAVAEDGSITLAGPLYRALDAPRPEHAVLVVTGPAGRTEYPASLSADGDAWSAVVRTAEITGPKDYADPIAVQRSSSVRLEVDGATQLIAVTPEARAAVSPHGHRMVTATRTVAGFLEIVEERVVPVVDEIAWSRSDQLRIRGAWLGPGPFPDTVILRYLPTSGGTVDIPVPVRVDRERFEYDVDTRALVRHAHHDRFVGRDAPPWHLLVPFGDAILTQVFDRTAASSFAPARRVKRRRVEVQLTRNDVVRLGVGV